MPACTYLLFSRRCACFSNASLPASFRWCRAKLIRTISKSSWQLWLKSTKLLWCHFAFAVPPSALQGQPLFTLQATGHIVLSKGMRQSRHAPLKKPEFSLQEPGTRAAQLWKPLFSQKGT